MASNKFQLLALCLLGSLVLAAASPMPAEQQQQQPKAAEVANDPLALGNDGSLFLSGGQTCEGVNEELAPGALPTCEPTCANPRPMCPKVFYSSLDFVPCFCKKPLVRNEKTKECVEVSQCPK